MAYDFEGKAIETTATGYLVNPDDWSEALAEHIDANDDPALKTA